MDVLRCGIVGTVLVWGLWGKRAGGPLIERATGGREWEGRGGGLTACGRGGFAGAPQDYRARFLAQTYCVGGCGEKRC